MGSGAREYEILIKNEHWNFRKIILREPWMSIDCSLCISEMPSLSWNRCQWIIICHFKSKKIEKKQRKPASTSDNRSAVVEKKPPKKKYPKVAGISDEKLKGKCSSIWFIILFHPRLTRSTRSAQKMYTLCHSPNGSFTIAVYTKVYTPLHLLTPFHSHFLTHYRTLSANKPEKSVKEVSHSWTLLYPKWKTSAKKW